MKLMHKILPIGFSLSQRQSHMPTNCPTCDEEIEDGWHWINYDARLAWRDTQAGTLSGRLGMLETEPGVKIIFSALSNLCSAQATSSSTTTTLKTTLQMNRP
jgi:hypothetical protein